MSETAILDVDVWQYMIHGVFSSFSQTDCLLSVLVKVFTSHRYGSKRCRDSLLKYFVSEINTVVIDQMYF